jgi:1-acyl-sn-glycerol-3-phosphate acyltransferase
MAEVVPLRPAGGRTRARRGRPDVDLDAVTDAPRTIGLRPTFEVDDWGRDAWMIKALGPLGRIRWDVSVGGAQHVPATGPALLVANARRFSLSSVYASWALSNVTGRVVRFVGRPDIAPVGPFMRRIGALLDRPDEVANALRNGEVVLISAEGTSHPRHVGSIRHELLTGAVLLDTPVVPVATMSNVVGRTARVEVAAPIRRRRVRRGPLAEVELADELQLQLQRQLDELGGYRTGLLPFDWLGDR